MRIALAKGRLSEQATEKFKAIGMAECLDLASRKLVFKDTEKDIEYMLLKPSDVITYVENGVADLGVVGSDVIMERDEEVYELFDLGFGQCKFSIASKKGNSDFLDQQIIRVATKYPKVAKTYFDSLNKPIEIIPLNGSVELAPLVGLSDCIVDIVETGNTLRANDLEVLEDMYNVSARLICNKVSYRFFKEEIFEIIRKLRSIDEMCS